MSARWAILFFLLALPAAGFAQDEDGEHGLRGGDAAAIEGAYADAAAFIKRYLEAK